MFSLREEGLLWPSLCSYVCIHTCWLKICFQIFIPRTWKSQLKKPKNDVEKLKYWMVFYYNYEKTSFSLSLLSLFHYLSFFSLCKFPFLIPFLCLQPHFCRSLLCLPCSIFCLFFLGHHPQFLCLPPPSQKLSLRLLL